MISIDFSRIIGVLVLVTCSLAGATIELPLVSFISPRQIKQMGDTVELKCRVQHGEGENLYTVTWLKKNRDTPPTTIAVGQHVLISDERFSTRINSTDSLHTLQIKSIQEKDSGTYKCQVGAGSHTTAADAQLQILPQNSNVSSAGSPSVSVPNNSNASSSGNGSMEISTVLADVNETIQSTQYLFYKQKTKSTLSHLNQVIPILQTIQQSVSELLAAPPQAFPSYKQTQDNLDEQLSTVENQIEANKRKREEDSSACGNADTQLKAVYQILENTLAQQN